LSLRDAGSEDLADPPMRLLENQLQEIAVVLNL
jgi:hypothetical protein